MKPNQVIDVQSLAGDTSDNIPGVPGIGVKTAAELINKYKNLDTLLNNLDEIKQKKRKETLKLNVKNALLSRKLVTLKNDVPIKNELESFRLKEVNKDKLFDFLREMEFNRLLSQVISFYGDNSKATSNAKVSKIDTKKYINIDTDEKLENLIAKIKNEALVAVDTETSSLNPLEAKLIGISLCYKEGISYYVSMAHNSGKNVSLEKSLKKLKIILEDKSIKKIGQNIKYDIMVLKKYGIQINPFEDTMLLSYTLDAGLNRHNLDLLSEIHLGHKTIQYKDLVGSGKKKLNFNEVDTNKATEYAAEDADVTFRLYKYFKTRLDEDKLNGIYENFEKPMVSVLSKMEENGIKVDKDYLVDLSKKFQNRISKIEKQIFIISKKEFNIGSPKQLGEIIYNDLKIAKLKKTKREV